LARLNIEARGSGRIAASDGVIVACVTDDRGVAVTELEAGDFALRAIAAGTGDQELSVVELRSPLAGIYVVRVAAPALPAAELAGPVVVAVVVTRRFDRGQCLAGAAW
jgi:hypothetical protein